MNDVLTYEQQLQNEARSLLRSVPVLDLLGRLGSPIQTGSSVTGLMAYPDIDFSVQNDAYDITDAIKLMPILFSTLKAIEVKITDFKHNKNESAGYYLGFVMPFNNKNWHIDATISKVGPISMNPPELTEWLAGMNEEERLTILSLKKELLAARRYVGARSQPPYTFRSVHLYEAVLKGGAKTIADVESYFA